MSDEHWLEKALRGGRLDKIKAKSDREYEAGKALDSLEPQPRRRRCPASARSFHRMVSGKAFKIKCRYVYPWLESTKTFRTREEAMKELRAWQRAAREQGQEMTGRVIAANGDAELPAEKGRAN